MRGVKGSVADHGTLARYASNAYRCRCDACKKAGSEYYKGRYEQKRRGKKVKEPVKQTAAKEASTKIKDVGFLELRDAISTVVRLASLRRLMLKVSVESDANNRVDFELALETFKTFLHVGRGDEKEISDTVESVAEKMAQANEVFEKLRDVVGAK